MTIYMLHATVHWFHILWSSGHFLTCVAIKKSIDKSAETLGSIREVSDIKERCANV